MLPTVQVADEPELPDEPDDVDEPEEEELPLPEDGLYPPSGPSDSSHLPVPELHATAIAIVP
jgi:hypothetical protein